MVRKCSHCGNTGHNSRTCRGTSVVGGLRLFGVQLDISSSSSSSFNNIAMMKKSFSMDCFCLPSISSPSPSSSLSSSRLPIHENSDKPCIGYLSDGLISPTQQEIRKKGVVWTEEEHRTFLAGLEKLGKGDWRGISRNFVTSRTPTQVASHAQKYFLRQATLNNKKRRSSLFDMVGSCNRVQSHVNNSKPSDPPIPAHFLGTTSSCHEAHHDTTLPFRYMQSARDSRHCGVWVGSDDTTRPLLDLNSSSQDVKSDNQESNYSQLSSRPHAMSIWLYGSLNSQLKSSTTTNPISPNAAPDLGLELTLAAPRPMDQNKSSSSPLLIGPISVV